MPIGTTIALIASIAGLAGTGISVGETLANRPGSPPKPVAPSAADTADAANKTKQQQIMALAAGSGNAQAATGGSLTPQGTANFDLLSSGQAGTPGISAAMQDLITKLISGNTGGTVSAGNNTPNATPGTPGSTQGLTNTTFG